MIPQKEPCAIITLDRILVGSFWKTLLDCSASFVHATFVDEIWETIRNLEFRRLDPRKQNFLDFRRSIAALVKTAIFLEISGFFTRNLM